MRVLHVHNFYQLPGGEDQSFAATGTMLEDNDHEVTRFTLRNDDIVGTGRFTAAAKSFWNSAAHGELTRLIRETKPDIAHFENTFPLVSPAAYYACHAERVPVVQTLHNFRIVCPPGMLFRNGTVCEDCIGKWAPWPGVMHGCYRGSRVGTAVVAAMTTSHRMIGTWSRRVDAYIALNSFVWAKFTDAGLPKDKVHISGNFLPSSPEPGGGKGGYAVFAGRLSAEKGIRTLLDAWATLEQDIPLKILGDGPEADLVAAACKRHQGIEWLGWRTLNEVEDLIGDAKFIVVPSVCYETFNRTQIEAFAKGTPVVASNLGSMQAIVDHERTGRLFTPNDPDDLVREVRALLAAPEACESMRRAARAEFETHYTAEVSYERLMAIYQAAHDRMMQQKA